MRIIGIDPGTATTGYSIIENKNGEVALIDYGCILTDKSLPQNQRLHQISSDISKLISKYKPKHASIEKLFFNKNVKTAMKVSEARGVILEKLFEAGIDSNEYTPLEIKSSVCGHARADKRMVQDMVKLIFKLKTIPRPDDAADAIAAALCFSNSLALESKINE